MFVILATLYAEIGRISVQGQPEKNVCETPCQTIPGSSGSYLSTQLHGRLRLGGLRFQASLIKKKTLSPKLP
jgi:hypothetical protein